MIAANNGMALRAGTFLGGNVIGRVDIETAGIAGQVARGMQRGDLRPVLVANTYKKPAALTRIRRARRRQNGGTQIGGQ